MTEILAGRSLLTKGCVSTRVCLSFLWAIIALPAFCDTDKKTADFYEANLERFINRPVELYISHVKRARIDLGDEFRCFDAHTESKGSSGGWMTIVVFKSEADMFVKRYGLKPRYKHDSVDYMTKPLHGILVQDEDMDLYVLFSKNAPEAKRMMNALRASKAKRKPADTDADE